MRSLRSPGLESVLDKFLFLSSLTLFDCALKSVNFFQFKSGGVDSIVWRLDSHSLLTMDAEILNRPDGKIDGEPIYDGKITDIGLTFSYPEQEVAEMKRLAQGL